MKPFARALTLTVLFALVLFAIAGCAGSSKDAQMVQSTVEREMVAPETAREYGEKANLGAAESPADESYDMERMIIRTGYLSLMVEDTAAVLQQITSITEGMGGHVANSNAYHSGDLLRGSVMVRVPATKFTSAMEQFKSLATRVENENTSADDVTEEYSDLSARLRNLEATEVELRELLATVRERTGKAEDILAVHRELTSIRGQIEQLKGRMQYLERSTDLATINIELIPNQIRQPIVESSWNPGLTLKNAFRALVNAFQFVVDALIWFAIAILPILIIIAIPIVVLIWIVRRSIRRNKAKREARATPATEE
jgi:hypothetical protein